MSQRAYSRLLGRYAKEDLALFQEAADRIHASKGLRLLLYRFFEDCGMAQSPFNPDPLTTARNCGKLEAAMTLRDLIESIDPDLPAALHKEITDYDRSRSDQLDQRLDNLDEYS